MLIKLNDYFEEKFYELNDFLFHVIFFGSFLGALSGGIMLGLDNSYWHIFLLMIFMVLLFSFIIASREENIKSFFECFLIIGLVSTSILGICNLPTLIALSPLSITILTISLIVFAEAIFLSEPKVRKPTLLNVAWRKIVALFEAVILLMLILNIKWLVTNVQWQEYFPLIMRWVGYIGFGLICLSIIGVIVYGWLKLNQRFLKK